MDDDLKKILEENLQLSRENHQMLLGIKRHFFWQSMLGWFYFIIIVGPIIWGIIYLPSLLGPVIGQYKDLLGVSGNSINLQDLQKSITTGSLNK
ncbi:MAG TPA: hypothetical protein VMD74_02725 [Candidatus Methylomirabilis sp.]|nr:hypothetical protein [Candidatus Methylomirabilis sp.]